MDRFLNTEHVKLRLVLVGLLAAAWPLAAGCEPAGQGLVQATGTVLVDDKPATGASVVFFPDPDEPSRVAAGVVDENGKYSLITNLEPGVHPGKYKVTLIWPDPSANGGAKFSLGNSKDPPDLLKSRFADPRKTSLQMEVTPTSTELTPIKVSIK